MPEHPLSYYKRRDAEILKLFASGYSCKDLAQEYDLSVGRVRQLIRWAGGRRGRKPTKKTPSQIMLGLGLDVDLVSLELIRFKRSD